jgi:hypothetical protein
LAAEDTEEERPEAAEVAPEAAQDAEDAEEERRRRREAAGKPGEVPRRRIRIKQLVVQDERLVASHGVRAPSPPPVASPLPAASPLPLPASQAAQCRCSGNCGGRLCIHYQNQRYRRHHEPGFRICARAVAMTPSQATYCGRCKCEMENCPKPRNNKTVASVRWCRRSAELINELGVLTWGNVCIRKCSHSVACVHRASVCIYGSAVMAGDD